MGSEGPALAERLEEGNKKLFERIQHVYRYNSRIAGGIRMEKKIRFIRLYMVPTFAPTSSHPMAGFYMTLVDWDGREFLVALGTK